MTMNKITTLLMVLAVALIQALPAHAVLKEKDLAQTLSVLRLELEQSYREQKSFMLRYEQQSAAQHKQLIVYMKRSEQIGLMLYSQKNDFTFDVAYACNEAASLYKQLNKTNIPYDRIRTRMISEIARYDSLIASLRELPPAIEMGSKMTTTDSINQKMTEKVEEAEGMVQAAKPFILSEEEQKDRERCLLYAKALRNNLIRILNSIEEDQQYYSLVTDKVGKLYNYSQNKYKDIQSNLFQDAGTNYFKMLRALPQQIQHAKHDYDDKYRAFGTSGKRYSEWRGPIVLAVSVFMLFYIFLATLLSNLILRTIPALTRRFFPKFAQKFEAKVLKGWLSFDYEGYKKRLPTIVLALGVFIFAIAITFVNQFISLNLYIMASKLMISFAWLFEAILISLLVRLKPEQTWRGVAIYLPFIFMALTIIIFRIILIPNNLVNLICPPLILIFTIWQYFSIMRHKNHLPFMDMVYSGVSLAVLIGSCIFSWLGYTLMAVQVIIWWTFLLAAVETINCIYDLLNMYEHRILIVRIIKDASTFGARRELIRKRNTGELDKAMNKGQYIHKTWLFDFVEKTIVPVATVGAVIASFYWAADIFEMTAACTELFTKLIIDEPKYIQLSLAKLAMVIALYFLFKYLNYATHSLYFMLRQKRAQEKGGDFNETLAKNVIAILVWGLYIIVSLITLKVPQTGISVVLAGLATGMGFAMKDLLENFFYGISLMSGRVRVGDYIECDGIQGKVESITYQSTQVTTLDGSVIAFLNASLFNKNFKNLTRNHGYILVKLAVGVAYGTDIAKARQLIIKAITPLIHNAKTGQNIVDPKKEISVVVDNFGDNSIDLIVTAWVLFDQKWGFSTQARERIYTTFNENGIEIPFPQRDVYIRSVVNNTPRFDDK